MQYRTEKNKGLPTSFNLKDGRFELIGGAVKCQDNMRMLLAFGNWFRYYYQDFCVNLMWLYQKPTSWIGEFKVIFLGQFIASAKKYAGFINIKKANVFYDATERTELLIGIEYTYTIEPDKTIQTIETIR